MTERIVAMKVTSRDREHRSNTWGIPIKREVEVHFNKHDDEALVLNVLVEGTKQMALCFTREQLAQLAKGLG